MRKYTLLFIVLVVAAACRKTVTTTGSGMTTRSMTTGVPADLPNGKVNALEPPVPPFLDKTVIGAKLGADGAVSDQQNIFTAGEPMHLTMRFTQSPAGLQASIRVADELR